MGHERCVDVSRRGSSHVEFCCIDVLQHQPRALQQQQQAEPAVTVTTTQKQPGDDVHVEYATEHNVTVLNVYATATASYAASRNGSTTTTTTTTTTGDDDNAAAATTAATPTATGCGRHDGCFWVWYDDNTSAATATTNHDATAAAASIGNATATASPDGW